MIKVNADEPLPGRDVSKVADPQHVWRRRSELPVHLVFWAWLALIRDGCVLHLPANNAMDSKAFHQPGHSAAGDLEFLTLSVDARPFGCRRLDCFHPRHA